MLNFLSSDYFLSFVVMPAAALVLGYLITGNVMRSYKETATATATKHKLEITTDSDSDGSESSLSSPMSPSSPQGGAFQKKSEKKKKKRDAEEAGQTLRSFLLKETDETVHTEKVKENTDDPEKVTEESVDDSVAAPPQQPATEDETPRPRWSMMEVDQEDDFLEDEEEASSQTTADSPMPRWADEPVEDEEFKFFNLTPSAEESLKKKKEKDSKRSAQMQKKSKVAPTPLKGADVLEDVDQRSIDERFKLYLQRKKDQQGLRSNTAHPKPLPLGKGAERFAKLGKKGEGPSPSTSAAIEKLQELNKRVQGVDVCSSSGKSTVRMSLETLKRRVEEMMMQPEEMGMPYMTDEDFSVCPKISSSSISWNKDATPFRPMYQVTYTGDQAASWGSSWKQYY